MPSKLLTLMALTIGLLGLISFVSPAPISLKNYWKQSKGLNGTERHIVQRCLYYGAAGDRYSVGPNFPAAFCARLYRPESQAPEDQVALLSPREQVMREFFYLEGGQLWSLYLDLDACYLEKGEPLTENCPSEALSYEGIFNRDYRENRYQLRERMVAAVRQYQPTARRLEHCLHLHQQEQPQPLFFEHAQLYGPCAKYMTSERWSKAGGNPQMPPGVERHRGEWKANAARRHYRLKVGNLGTFYNYDKVVPALNSWEGIESFIYRGLYTRLNSSWNAPGMEDYKREVMEMLEADWDALSGLDLEERLWLNRFREHFYSNLNADEGYDCLKFHRHEAVPWCKGVTWFPSLADKGRINWFESNFEAGDFMANVSALVEEERLADQAKLLNVAYSQLPFLYLPEKIVEYCRKRGEDHAENPDEDCREGGLYHNFFL